MTPIGDACLSALEAVAEERKHSGFSLMDAAQEPGLSDAERWRIKWEAIGEIHTYLHLSDLASYHRLRRILHREAA
jgi:hypothetical protein